MRHYRSSSCRIFAFRNGKVITSLMIIVPHHCHRRSNHHVCQGKAPGFLHSWKTLSFPNKVIAQLFFPDRAGVVSRKRSHKGLIAFFEKFLASYFFGLFTHILYRHRRRYASPVIDSVLVCWINAKRSWVFEKKHCVHRSPAVKPGGGDRRNDMSIDDVNFANMGHETLWAGRGQFSYSRSRPPLFLDCSFGCLQSKVFFYLFDLTLLTLVYIFKPRPVSLYRVFITMVI